MRTVIVSLMILASAFVSRSQMLDPAIDRPGEPFCYFSQPTDEIGVMDGRSGTEVTPEGYLYTGYGELMFFTGNPPEPVRQRVKTLVKGYLPIVQYGFDRGGVRYHLAMFAATLDGKPESDMINFVRISLKNVSRQDRAAFFSTAIRYENEASTTWGVGDNRFGRPRKAKVLGQYEQAGADFSRDWEYGFADDALLRDGRIMYFFPMTPKPALSLTLKTGYNESQDIKPAKLYVLPTTPVGIATFTLQLKPGEEQSLDLKMPYNPVPKDSSFAEEIRRASFDDYFKRTVDFWENIFSQGIDISIPEEKVVNTFKANLVYDLIARNKVDSFYVQTVNDFQYHAFWLRDASYIVRMYDVSGYHDIARQCLDFFGRWQQPDGNFVSQGGQYDGWGQTLWAYGQHFRMTRDTAFASSVLPSIERAVTWLKKVRSEDPLHIIPVTAPGDNEDIKGHITGHNFAALGGLQQAIAIPEALGRQSIADDWKKEYDDYRSTLINVLHKVTASTNGFMPPGLDTLGGQDWGNMESIYPVIVLDPSDPMITATLKTTRAKYKEGIMTYGDGRWLHHYLTISNTESEVIRGEDKTAIEELYAILVHTSATNAGFEFAILPWSTRDFGMNLSPHGWFAAKYRTLIRDMMVREQGDTLHLFSCLSPAWVKEGASVSVHRAPTTFGSIDAVAAFGKSGAEISLKSSFHTNPDDIVLHFPWFVDVSSVKADGKAIRFGKSAVAVPPGTKRVEIAWKKTAGTPELSYDHAVGEFKKEYKKRYDEFLLHGDAK